MPPRKACVRFGPARTDPSHAAQRTSHVPRARALCTLYTDNVAASRLVSYNRIISSLSPLAPSLVPHAIPPIPIPTRIAPAVSPDPPIASSHARIRTSLHISSPSPKLPYSPRTQCCKMISSCFPSTPLPPFSRAAYRVRLVGISQLQRRRGLPRARSSPLVLAPNRICRFFCPWLGF
ncbi:hypothetical protein PYCCODRAFT_649451 [Trametes coccinea BRFM310]|uniref:Uncharacterized protein n=1 Tax=Trametes coccinea (strain BRFM310) TaxID=1353009 RepID=A0A1Y2ILR9_TRAC3|nr:hypothetical protein PYCCODRAFT_649451 [Trametes coccinea BRFM310]